jgi:hypothetical protein
VRLCKHCIVFVVVVVVIVVVVGGGAVVAVVAVVVAHPRRSCLLSSASIGAAIAQWGYVLAFEILLPKLSFQVYLHCTAKLPEYQPARFPQRTSTKDT